ncbi:MAG: hypothetical protein UT05_C0002G0063 [Parcubacteria group bacterium GW2011_GWF2_38_76]|nr:MAG: hypothetical protein UT05_C0002G0063 [Parcubacteria group bacterium GW2011_GWF2_38_76]HBM45779.1 hypothetical protein [Patescibacteria group bacterium]
MKKTIFITSFHSIISKNIFNSDVLKILSEDKNINIVIFVPSHKKELFEKYYKRDNIIFEGINLEPLINSKINTFFSRISFLLMDSHYLWYKKAERLETAKNLRGYLKYYYEIVFTKILSGHRFVNNFYRFFDYLFTPKNFFKKYFDAYNPNMVFVTDLFDKTDSAFLREAKSNKVFSIGMVRSWDNCWSKGLMRVLPDKFIVNNEVIKDEIVSMHNADKKNIFVGGLPQFDKFLSMDLGSRKDFFEKLKIREDRRLLMFSPLGYSLSDVDWEILQIFKDAIKNGDLPENIQFLIRMHPGRPLPLKDFTPDDHFYFDKPGIGEGKDVEFRPDDVEHLAKSLYFSEIIIWVATTLGLDAAVFNKPQIVVNFDGWEKREYINSVRRYHNENHMRKMIDCGGVKEVLDRESLIEAINKYLNNPSLDQTGRDAMVKQQLYKIDGRSGERIANFILSELEKIDKK